MTQFTTPPAPGEVEAFIGHVVTDLSAAVSGVPVNVGASSACIRRWPTSAPVRRWRLQPKGVRDMLTALLFRFPFPGPWGKELTEAVHELARDIANEYGLVWKIWLENRETGHAGAIYLFEPAAAAERYREKHERRLSAMGLTGVMANAFSVNTELSVLTMARAALGDAGASKSTSATTAAIPS